MHIVYNIGKDNLHASAKLGCYIGIYICETLYDSATAVRSNITDPVAQLPFAHLALETSGAGASRPVH